MNILELREVAVHAVCFMLTVLRGYNKQHDIVLFVLLPTLTYLSLTIFYREANYALKIRQQVLLKCLYTIYYTLHPQIHDIQCSELSLSAILLAS
jgi:hypothetical protein